MGAQREIPFQGEMLIICRPASLHKDVHEKFKESLRPCLTDILPVESKSEETGLHAAGWIDSARLDAYSTGSSPHYRESSTKRAIRTKLKLRQFEIKNSTRLSPYCGHGE